MNQPFWQQLKKEPPTRQTWQPTNDNNYNTSITCFNKSKSHVKAKAIITSTRIQNSGVTTNDGMEQESTS